MGAALVRGKAPEAGFKASYCFLRVQRPRVTEALNYTYLHGITYINTITGLGLSGGHAGCEV